MASICQDNLVDCVKTFGQVCTKGVYDHAFIFWPLSYLFDVVYYLNSIGYCTVLLGKPGWYIMYIMIYYAYLNIEVVHRPTLEKNSIQRLAQGLGLRISGLSPGMTPSFKETGDLRIISTIQPKFADLKLLASFECSLIQWSLAWVSHHSNGSNHVLVYVGGILWNTSENNQESGSTIRQATHEGRASCRKLESFISK